MNLFYKTDRYITKKLIDETPIIKKEKQFLEIIELSGT